jgi:hypothetical protein
MKKFLITEEEKSRILGMHKSAIAREFLGEQATPAAPATATPATATPAPAPAAAAPTTTTQTTQPPAQPTQQAVKKEFIIAKNGTSVGMTSIDTDVKAVITKLSDKNGTYYSVVFNGLTGYPLRYNGKELQPKIMSLLNNEEIRTKLGVNTTDTRLLNEVDRYISKKVKAAADSF